MSDRTEPGMGMPGGQKKGATTRILTAHNPHDDGDRGVAPGHVSSTHVFDEATHGEHAFGCAYGVAEMVERTEAADGPRPMEPIYGRLGTPQGATAEAMMAAMDMADFAFGFPSGMAALNVLARCCARPGSERDVILYGQPLYGGSHALMTNVLPDDGITTVEVDMNDPDALRTALKEHAGRVGLVCYETPSNPTLVMTDIRAVADVIAELPEDQRPVHAVDNTFMGIFQNPLDHGADVTWYSATKFLGGHSDLIAGFLVGRHGRMVPDRPFEGELGMLPLAVSIGKRRTITGPCPGARTMEALSMHMQTYVLRMRQEAENAIAVAAFLAEHPAVLEVRHPSLIDPDSCNGEVYARQCSGPSALIAFRVIGDTREAAFAFLNGLKIALRAVSLGNVRTLMDVPRFWTHSDIGIPDQERMGITAGLIRMSVGIENVDDLIDDLDQALNALLETPAGEANADEAAPGVDKVA